MINSPQLNILYGFDPPGTVNVTENLTTPIENQLIFNIANPAGSALVKFVNTQKLTPQDKIPPIEGGTGLKDLSLFFIYFPWGNDPGELCSLDLAANITCSAGPDNDSWFTVQRTSPKIGVYWTLFPKKDTVLDAQESVAFILDNIITYAKPGMTYITIMSRNIPGYIDDSKEVEVFKVVPPLSILSFIASPGTIGKGGSSTLSWQTMGAEYCTLNPGNKRVGPFGQMDVTADHDQTFPGSRRTDQRG